MILVEGDLSIGNYKNSVQDESFDNLKAQNMNEGNRCYCTLSTMLQDGLYSKMTFILTTCLRMEEPCQ